jgi:phosphoglycolate phosphatase
MIKNIVFDFNGTLLDDLKLSVDIEEALMINNGLRPYTLEEYLDKFFFPIREYYRYIGIKDENFSKSAEYFNNEYNSRWSKETSLHSGVIKALKDLKKAGYRLFVLSASEEEFLISQLKALGIYEYFDGVCGARNDLAYGKIEYGKTYAKEHHIEPNETGIIGDTCHDFEVANELHFKCILFTKGHNSKARLEKLGVKTFDDFNLLSEVMKAVD